MKSAAFQKAENKSHSTVASLFRKENNCVSGKANLAFYENVGKPPFNFNNISIFNSGKNLRVKPKLQINQPGDKYEQEANAIAENILKMTDKELNPPIISANNSLDNKKIKRKEKSPGPVQGNSAIDSYVDSLGSSGSPLSSATRQFFEPRFRHDFSDVQVHTGKDAAQSAQLIGAHAYTAGKHIVFNDGQYSPASEPGKRLLAHELAHVVQQRKMSELSIMKWSLKKENDAIEKNILEEDKLIEVFVNDFDLPGEKGNVKAIYESYILNKQLFSQVDLSNLSNKRTFLDIRSDTDLLVRKWKDRVQWDTILVDKLNSNDRTLYFTIKASLDKKVIKDGDTTYKPWVNNIDHIVELQLGGSDGQENLQILAKDPNQKSGREINKRIGEIANAYKKEHKSEDQKGKQLKISIISLKVDGSFPSVGVFQFPLEPNVAKFAKGEIEINGKAYNFIAGANKANAIFEDAELNESKEYEIKENNTTNKSFKRFIPLIKLNKIKGKKADHLEGEFNPQEGRLPIKLTKSQHLSFKVDDARNIKSTTRSKAFDFYYQYLSAGKITELNIENGEVTGKGKIYPSVKFIKELDIEFSKDYFRIVKQIDIKSPLSSIKITQSSISLDLFPQLVAQGTIGFVAGNEKKPLMQAVLKAGADANGFFAEGDAEFFIPNVDKATGKVSYKKVNDVYSLQAAVDAKITAKGKKFIKEGDVHATYKDGVISASGNIGLDIPNTKDTKVGVEYKNGNWILKGKTTVTIPKLNDVTFDIVYDVDKDKLRGTGKTDFKFKSFKGSIELTYNDGKISGKGTLDVTKGKVMGSAKVKLSEEGKLSGEGSVTVELMKGVQGTVGIIIDEKEKVTAKGQIKVLKPYQIFPKKEIGKNLFENSFKIPLPGVSIGPVGLVLEIKFGADFNAGIGPGVLNDILINASFNPFEDDKNPSFSFSTQFNVNAYAKLAAYIQAALAIDAVIADVKGGIRLTGIALVNANLNIPLMVKYEQNVFSIDSEIKALVALILGLNIEGIVEANVARGYIGHWEKRWMLKQFTYAPPGARFGMSLPIKYASDKPFVLPGLDDIKITQPEIDSKKMLSDTMSTTGDEKKLS